MTGFQLKHRTALPLVISLAIMLAVAASGLGTAPVQGQTGTADLPPLAQQDRPSAQGPGITPSSGPPGTPITVRGAGFRSFAAVESITLGGLNILGNRTVNTDARGDFEAADLIVPGLDPGIVSLTVRVGTGDLETTAVGTFEVTATNGVPAAPQSPAADALLPLGDALERVFYFNNLNKTWSFFDPRAEFAEANTLLEVVEGQVYWIKVTRSTSAILNDRERQLTCANQGTPQEDCWNLVVW